MRAKTSEEIFCYIEQTGGRMRSTVAMRRTTTLAMLAPTNHDELNDMTMTSMLSLFNYKAWANAELFSLLASLPPQQGDQMRGSIRTLNHIYVVDRIFRARLM